MAQCRKMIGKRRCKASCIKGTHYCVFHSKKNSNSVARRKVESKELSASEKFVIKQAANRSSKIAGDLITAKAVYNLANPEGQITTVISGRYVPQASITANERFLSESKFQKDVQSAQQRHVKLKVKGKPGKGKRYRSTTDFVRADRSILGRVKVKKTGKDYLHSIEDFEQRERRLAKNQRRNLLTAIGGRALRYGVPVLMTAWTIHDMLKRDGDFYLQKDAESMYGRGLGTALSYSADTLLWGGLDPLPTGPTSSATKSTVLPMIFYMFD